MLQFLLLDTVRRQPVSVCMLVCVLARAYVCVCTCAFAFLVRCCRYCYCCSCCCYFCLGTWLRLRLRLALPQSLLAGWLRLCHGSARVDSALSLTYSELLAAFLGASQQQALISFLIAVGIQLIVDAVAKRTHGTTCTKNKHLEFELELELDSRTLFAVAAAAFVA